MIPGLFFASYTAIMVYFSNIMVFNSCVKFCRINSEEVFYMGLQENIAAYIRDTMKREKKSLTEFSEELGISRNALYDYSTGEGNPTILTLEHIAEKMGISPAALILGILELDQREVLLLLTQTIQDVAKLPEEKREQFVELFLKMVKLWDVE